MWEDAENEKEREEREIEREQETEKEREREEGKAVRLQASVLNGILCLQKLRAEPS